MQKSLWKYMLSLLAVVLISAFGPLFLYLNNAGEANFSEVCGPLLAFCVFGAALYVLLCLITRSGGKSAIAAGLWVLALTNFSMIEKLGRMVFPSLRYWHTATIVVVLLLHLTYLVVRFVPQELSEDVTKVLCLVFGGLIVINMITGVPKAIERAQALRTARAPAVSQEGTPKAQGKPNVYWLLFDEYADFPQMETYYGYDNQVLRDFMEQHAFNLSETSINESTSTTTVLTNLMDLNYSVDDNTADGEKEAIRKNGALDAFFQKQGYQIQTLETEDFLGGQSPLGDKRDGGAATEGGENLADLLFQRSLLYPFVKKGSTESMDDIMQIVDYMSAAANLPESDTFVKVYLCFPHIPFLVDENGAPVSPMHSVDWENDQYYLGQYKYATKLMMQIAENLISHDPNSIIMIQSDHGARAGGASHFEPWFMYNPFNAVYFKGEPFEIEGLSSVNTMRAILNRLFGTDFEMLTVPGSVGDRPS